MTSTMSASSFDWSDFYLICFAVGFCFSFFSFVFGNARFGRLHLPHFHGHTQLPHLPASHGPVGSGAHAPRVGGVAAPSTDSNPNTPMHTSVSPFNFVTLTAFLAWFGGTGYLLARFSTVQVGLGLTLAVASGTVGGGIIFLFLSKVLMSDEENMDPVDYEMVGVLGRLCVSIRDGGTGEILYSQAGTRRVCGARSEDSGAIAKGTDVVVTRYEKGIAYVRTWSEMSGESDELADKSRS